MTLRRSPPVPWPAAPPRPGSASASQPQGAAWGMVAPDRHGATRPVPSGTGSSAGRANRAAGGRVRAPKRRDLPRWAARRSDAPSALALPLPHPRKHAKRGAPRARPPPARHAPDRECPRATPAGRRGQGPGRCAGRPPCHHRHTRQPGPSPSAPVVGPSRAATSVRNSPNATMLRPPQHRRGSHRRPAVPCRPRPPAAPRRGSRRSAPRQQVDHEILRPGRRTADLAVRAVKGHPVA